MNRPEGLHRLAGLVGEHALAPGDPIRRSLDPLDRGGGFVVRRQVPSKQDRRSWSILGWDGAPKSFLRNPTCCSGPTAWTKDGSLANFGLANFGLANFLARGLWARRIRGYAGSRPLRVGNRTKRQRGSLERPMSSGAWTSREVPSPAGLCRVARVFETPQIEKQEVGVLDRTVELPVWSRIEMESGAFAQGRSQSDRRVERRIG